jgi:hypothetical protein
MPAGTRNRKHTRTNAASYAPGFATGFVTSWYQKIPPIAARPRIAIATHRVERHASG